MLPKHFGLKMWMLKLFKIDSLYLLSTALHVYNTVFLSHHHNIAGTTMHLTYMLVQNMHMMILTLGFAQGLYCCYAKV